MMLMYSFAPHLTVSIFIFIFIFCYFYFYFILFYFIFFEILFIYSRRSMTIMVAMIADPTSSIMVFFNDEVGYFLFKA